MLKNTDQLIRAGVWTRYWSRGHAHSCGGESRTAYGQEIDSIWCNCFSSMPLKARILDLGTGNGPLLQIVLSLSNRPDLQCDAVDLAEVTPSWVLDLPTSERQRIRFHHACLMESLPFEAESFDLVVSQWGLEYSKLDVSVMELLRVLAPGGRVQLVLHHVDAVPVVLAGHELMHIEWLVAARGYLETVESILVPIAQAVSPEGRAKLSMDVQANALKEAFNCQQDAIESRIRKSVCPDLLVETREVTAQLFAMAQQDGVDSSKAALQRFRNELDDSRLRLQELRRHALDHKAALRLAKRLSKNGSYSLDVLRNQHGIMGWTLDASPGSVLKGE